MTGPQSEQRVCRLPHSEHFNNSKHRSRVHMTTTFICVVGFNIHH
ncbi:MAG: hypothetical protein ACPG4T_02875 [Nannocystaceae bacterium]